MLNLQREVLNYLQIPFSAILTGSAEDGTKFLKLFLQDVVEHLNVKQPNASCQKCLQDYYNRLTVLCTPKQEIMSKYKLLKKREGISLEFGSKIHVTNDNITDEYAEKLIDRFKKLNKNFQLSDLFQTYPKEADKQKAENKTTTKSEAKKEDAKESETEKESTEQKQKPKLNLKTKQL